MGDIQKKIQKAALSIILFLLKKVLLFNVGLAAIIGASFLVTKNFTWYLYGERLVWAGLFVVAFAGIIVMAQMGVGRDFGVPSMVRNTSQAKRAMEHNLTIRQLIEERYNLAVQFWIVGIFSILIGGLVQTIVG